MCTAAAAARRIMSGIRLRRIELWGAPVQSSTPTGNTVAIRDVSISPLGGSTGYVMDTHLGADRPAHVVWKPKPGSMAYSWLDATSTSLLLEITCTAGSVLDVEFDAVLGFVNGFTNSAVSAAVSSSQGVLAVRKLDSNGAGLFDPASTYSTF